MSVVDPGEAPGCCATQPEAIHDADKPGETIRLAAGIGAAVVLWFIVYRQLQPFADWFVGLLPVDRHGAFGEALAFFVYDTPKVLMLLSIVVFFMGILRSFFSAERSRAFLSGRREGIANAMAAGLGVLTPFCSCSAVPLFIGFISAGIPLGVTFSFLIAAPMVNEVALVMLLGLVGWKVAAIYLGFGLAIAIVAGWVIGRMRLEGWLQDWVREIRASGAVQAGPQSLTWPQRCRMAWDSLREIVRKVWIWIVAGIALGAFIHGYVPEDLLARVMGADAWWSVPAAVALGVPMYSNAAGVIPVVEALLDKGVALGTLLAFMMSVIALSLPELVILRQVLTLRLLAVFVGVVSTGILAVGYLFNALL